MPYIHDYRRRALAHYPEHGTITSAGELNYLITLLLIDYTEAKDVSYQTINDIVGALEGAKLEFYRRIAVPYENAKMAEHGDIY